jgi:hypothetical protein
VSGDSKLAKPIIGAPHQDLQNLLLPNTFIPQQGTSRPMALRCRAAIPVTLTRMDMTPLIYAKANCDNAPYGRDPRLHAIRQVVPGVWLGLKRLVWAIFCLSVWGGCHSGDVAQHVRFESGMNRMGTLYDGDELGTCSFTMINDGTQPVTAQLLGATLGEGNHAQDLTILHTYKSHDGEEPKEAEEFALGAADKTVVLIEFDPVLITKEMPLPIFIVATLEVEGDTIYARADFNLRRGPRFGRGLR